MSKSDRPPVVQFVSIFLGPLSRTGNWFSFPHIHRGLAGHLGGNRKSGARGLTSSRMRPRPLVSLPFYPVIDSAVASDSSSFFFSFLSLSLSLSFSSLRRKIEEENRGVNGLAIVSFFSFFPLFPVFLFLFREAHEAFLSPAHSFSDFFLVPKQRSIARCSDRDRVFPRRLFDEQNFRTYIRVTREGTTRSETTRRGELSRQSAVGDKNKRVTQRNKRLADGTTYSSPTNRGCFAPISFRATP